MVTPVGLTRTLATTSDLYAVFSMKVSKQRRPIKFRNGFRFNLIWSQFRTLRDSYKLLKKYAVKQLDDDLFRMSGAGQVFTGSLVTITSICELLQKYQIEQLQDNLFKIWSDKVQLTGSDGILYSIFEIETGVYDCDCRGKVVLDVGGFQGESAVYFSSLGASKVIVYEPVPDHQNLIKMNLAANHVNAEVNMEGIGESDGTQTIHYTDTSLGFGVLDRGKHQLDIRIADVARVISESGADVAKLDCEGAEESLLKVPRETLRAIDVYMIEVHTPTIRQEIIEKFMESGFKLTKETKRDIFMSILYFKRTATVGVVD
jgi:FkbM family methyltransferase